MSFGKLDVHGARYLHAVTSIDFSAFDPIGSLLVAFDSAVVKCWQATVRSEQALRLMEGQRHVDISETGFQQFDLADAFDMFENPHGLDAEVDDKARKLYQVSYSTCLNSKIEQEVQAVRRSVLAC